MGKNVSKVSIVLCTFNGEEYLKEQLDSIVQQTYPLYEVIAQDDGSTDRTLDILHEYAEKYPIIKVYKNSDHRYGLNSNFFNATKKATGDFIAFSDQDDIWELNKIEYQMKEIGDSFLCTHKTKPFSTVGLHLDYDDRKPNFHIIRLLYASIPGHTMLFKRDLLDKVPPINTNCYGTAYDVILQSVAASFKEIKVVDKVLSHHRRLPSSISYAKPDEHRKHSYSNALYELWWSMTNYKKVIVKIRDEKLKPRLELFENIQSDTKDYHDALLMSKLRTQTDFISLLRYSAQCIKHRNHLFYTETKGFLNFIRAALYPIMQVYNFRKA